MSALIAAEHGGIGCASWVYRAILSEISAVLLERAHTALAAWLPDKKASVQLYHCLDARDLTPANQEAFLAGLVAAHERAEVKGGGLA